MINYHYKNRYDNFIKTIQLTARTPTGYTEKHHIQPKCLKGNDDPSNIIRLTLREHHLAHWMLWKAYPNYLPIASAFLQMNNKNAKTAKADFKPLPSRVYESLKSQTYAMLSENRKNKVYVKDFTGKTIELSKEEYAKQNKLKFHTSGKLVAFDKEDKIYKSIETTEYHSNQQLSC